LQLLAQLGHKGLRAGSREVRAFSGHFVKAKNRFPSNLAQLLGIVRTLRIQIFIEFH
jgi:hypothetical protein